MPRTAVPYWQDARNTLWICAAVTALPAIFAFVLASSMGFDKAVEMLSLIQEAQEDRLRGVIYFTASVSLLGVVAGILCHKEKPVGRIVGTLVGFMSMPIFPLGTIFGFMALVKIWKPREEEIA